MIALRIPQGTAHSVPQGIALRTPVPALFGIPEGTALSVPQGIALGRIWYQEIAG